MKFTPKVLIGWFAVAACLVGSAWILRTAHAAEPQGDSHGPDVIRARAILFDDLGNESGVVDFTQSPADENLPEPTVDVVARVKSELLTPGDHGMHIHENGTCTRGTPTTFSSAGGHFDPGPFGNSTPVDLNHPYHMGDLPNLEVNEAQEGHLRHTTSRITLSPGPLSVFDANGSAVVVHLLPDQGVPCVPGPPDASGRPTGCVAGVGVSGGARLLCGVILPIEPTNKDNDYGR